MGHCGVGASVFADDPLLTPRGCKLMPGLIDDARPQRSRSRRRWRDLPTVKHAQVAYPCSCLSLPSDGTLKRMSPADPVLARGSFHLRACEKLLATPKCYAARSRTTSAPVQSPGLFCARKRRQRNARGAYVGRPFHSNTRFIQAPPLLASDERTEILLRTQVSVAGKRNF